MATLHCCRTLTFQRGNKLTFPYFTWCNAPCNARVPPVRPDKLAIVKDTLNVLPGARRNTRAAGSSKDSIYTQLPERLDEPTPGFDSVAAALEDLAAGEWRSECSSPISCVLTTP